MLLQAEVILIPPVFWGDTIYIFKSSFQNMFEKQGKKSLIISGDNYPHRIPMYNDAERIARFRMSGLNGLITERLYTDEVKEKLLELQKAGRDAEEQEDMQWLSIYQKYGDKALTDYLGTDQELDYEAVSNLLVQFHGGTSQLMLRHMGRTPDDIWYDRRDVSDTDILILEWTHGNSACLQGVDVSVVLISTPEETLENRKKRNRDTAIDSPFVARVLSIEQKKINDGLDRADIIQDMHGRIYTE